MAKEKLDDLKADDYRPPEGGPRLAQTVAPIDFQNTPGWKDWHETWTDIIPYRHDEKHNMPSREKALKRINPDTHEWIDLQENDPNMGSGGLFYIRPRRTPPLTS